MKKYFLRGTWAVCEKTVCAMLDGNDRYLRSVEGRDTSIVADESGRARARGKEKGEEKG